jgi:hypothetical protein
MNLNELAARNVTAAFREAMNAEHAMMLSLGLKYPINWKKLKNKDALAESRMRRIVAVCEELGTLRDDLIDRTPNARSG